MTSKRIVDKVYEGDDRDEILCTTYQMRNFYSQLGDGFFTVLDVMNYIQHHQAVKMVRRYDRVLDICCGRGLLLPMLRYHKKELDSYTGVDIKRSNATFRKKIVSSNKPLPPGHYPFAVYFVESDVARMDEALPSNYFDFLVYTSSLEHMHPDHGMDSLLAARAVAKDDAIMFLSCPVTPEDKDGYDTQYAAHVYEWKLSELYEGFEKSRWRVRDKWGLLMNVTDIEAKLRGTALYTTFMKQRDAIPSEWLAPAWAVNFPEDAKEVAFVLQAV